MKWAGWIVAGVLLVLLVAFAAYVGVGLWGMTFRG